MWWSETRRERDAQRKKEKEKEAEKEQERVWMTSACRNPQDPSRDL